MLSVAVVALAVIAVQLALLQRARRPGTSARAKRALAESVLLGPIVIVVAWVVTLDTGTSLEPGDFGVLATHDIPHQVFDRFKAEHHKLEELGLLRFAPASWVCFALLLPLAAIRVLAGQAGATAPDPQAEGS